MLRTDGHKLKTVLNTLLMYAAKELTEGPHVQSLVSSLRF